MKDFFKKNKVEALLLLGILALALFLRLYRIDGFMTFLGDEGRDVRIVRDLITKGDLVFIGPQTSVGNMYLGPLYYYMMAPALFLSGLNPVGPAIMVALISVITVFFTWYVTREWFGKVAAAVAALLYAVSPIAIIYGRTSWNPNPMPIFALLAIYGIYQVWQKKKYFWLPIIGIGAAFALQMHYLGLLLLPTLGLFWLFTLRKLRREKQSTKIFSKNTLLAVGLFLLLMSPLLLFDIKHQWMNTHAFLSMISAKSGVFDLAHFLSKPFSLTAFVFTALFSGIQNPSVIATIVITALVIISLFKKYFETPVRLLIAWLVFPILGLSLYNQPVYIHYFGLIYPAIFIFSGLVFSSFSKINDLTKYLSILFIAVFLIYDLVHSPAFGTPNNQLKRTEETVDSIISKSQNKPFNFGLIAKQNYDESYRYFFENKKANMIRGEDKITDQLFVICEDGDSCRPEGHPQYQIAIFGPSHVVSQWNIDYLKIYKLEHTL